MEQEWQNILVGVGEMVWVELTKHYSGGGSPMTLNDPIVDTFSAASDPARIQERIRSSLKSMFFKLSILTRYKLYVTINFILDRRNSKVNSVNLTLVKFNE